MRANAFAGLGSLSNYGVGAQREAFLEQVLLLNTICVKSLNFGIYNNIVVSLLADNDW